MPRRATSRIGTIGQRPVKTAPAPLRVLPRCKSSECGHLQTPYGRPFHSELGAHGWSRYGAPGSQPVATSGKSAGSRNRKNKRVPLPPPAASCVGKYMVRRGSTARVRQRALQKTRKTGFPFRIDLQVVELDPGMEPFMEPSGRKSLLKTRRRACRSRRTGTEPPRAADNRRATTARARSGCAATRRRHASSARRT